MKWRTAEPGFLGKPYEPNAVVKNDIEFILMERKSGGYRTPEPATRILSVIGSEDHKTWFQQIWTGVTGASTRYHPAPYPLELADRLVECSVLWETRCLIRFLERVQVLWRQPWRDVTVSVSRLTRII